LSTHQTAATFAAKLDRATSLTLECLIDASAMQHLVSVVGQADLPRNAGNIIDVYLRLRNKLDLSNPESLRFAGFALGQEYERVCGTTGGITSWSAIREHSEAYELVCGVSDAAGACLFARLPPQPPPFGLCPGKTLEQWQQENVQWAEAWSCASDPEWLAQRLIECYFDVREALKGTPLINTAHWSANLFRVRDEKLIEWRILTAAAPSQAWSHPGTVQEWASQFQLGRNKMSRLLRDQEIRNKRLGGRYQIAVEDLPKE
jgi:hypothetical protein